MAKYFRQSLQGLGTMPGPVFSTLNGLKLMRRAPVEALVRAQDYVPALSRRVVASGGMRGSETWFTPDTDPSVSDGTHPDPGSRRLIGAGSVDLTPGCFLRLMVACVPSGETQTGTAGIDLRAAGPDGACDVDVDWTDATGTVVSTTHRLALPASTATYGAEPGNMFSHVHELQIGSITPPAIVATDDLRRWCQHVNIKVEIYAVGGARIIDAVVMEWPHEIAMEADDDSDRWVSHLYAPGKPSQATAPMQYPWQRHSETSPDGDPRGGAWHVMDVHHAQHMRLGPVLFSWCAARESDGTESVTTASTSLVAIEGGGSTTFDLTEPGLAVGCGGYARRQSDNSEFVLRDRVAAIPVIVRVYASSGGTGTVRVQTRSDSYIDVTITGGSLAWHSIQGWLEVGITPDDTAAVLAQLWYEEATVAAVTVYYAGGYIPTDA